MNVADGAASPAGDAEGRPRATDGPGRRRRIGMKAICLLGLALAVTAGLGYGLRPRREAQDALTAGTAPVVRGDLTVTVTEGGYIEPLKSFEVTSKVEGQCTILRLIDEGTLLTEQDVEDGTVLVELDSSQIEDRRGRRLLAFYNAEAAYLRAQSNLAIQTKQNESDLALAELNVKFARMELDRYLGSELATALLEGKSDFTGLADNAALGGVARQTMDNYEASLLLRDEELTRAQETLTWSRQLFEKGYVNRNELTGDELQAKSAEIKVSAAREDLRLFERYTLPKEAEQRFSDHVESARELDRVKARARSQMAQAEADLKCRQASYDLEKERLRRTEESLTNCIIRAPRPGYVVHASRSRRRRRRSRTIREGESVSENQAILIMPDRDHLAATVNIHETDIRKVKVGQKAFVKVEALPDRKLPGTVKEICAVASAIDARLNPEIRVYQVDVALDEIPAELTVGMTATAEIVVADLDDALTVPIEAVVQRGGDHVCVVARPEGPQVRTIEVGHATAGRVEVRSGLEEGELVYQDPGRLLGLAGRGREGPAASAAPGLTGGLPWEG